MRVRDGPIEEPMAVYRCMQVGEELEARARSRFGGKGVVDEVCRFDVDAR